jgi:hypothetical protein
MSKQDAHREARRHLVFGWWALLVYLAAGLGLEALHGFKVGLYLDVDQSTRRLMWTLAHAHGTLLALVNLAFAFTVERVSGAGAVLRLASRCLLAATVLLPLGFFLGGLDIRGGDPGLGIGLVALGGLILLVGVLATARGVTASTDPALSPPAPGGADGAGSRIAAGKAGKAGKKRR